jgi:hypothetical protein
MRKLLLINFAVILGSLSSPIHGKPEFCAPDVFELWNARIENGSEWVPGHRAVIDAEGPSRNLVPPRIDVEIFHAHFQFYAEAIFDD